MKKYAIWLAFALTLALTGSAHAAQWGYVSEGQIHGYPVGQHITYSSQGTFALRGVKEGKLAISCNVEVNGEVWNTSHETGSSTFGGGVIGGVLGWPKDCSIGDGGLCPTGDPQELWMERPTMADGELLESSSGIFDSTSATFAVHCCPVKSVYTCMPYQKTVTLSPYLYPWEPYIGPQYAETTAWQSGAEAPRSPFLGLPDEPWENGVVESNQPGGPEGGWSALEYIEGRWTMLHGTTKMTVLP